MNTDEKYLHLLSNIFPTVADASREIINLEAILNLPKGTEHFLPFIRLAQVPDRKHQRSSPMTVTIGSAVSKAPSERCSPLSA